MLFLFVLSFHGLRFCFSSDQWKSTVKQGFYKEFEWNFCLKIIVIINLKNFGYKFAFIRFLSFHRNKKQESNFQQVGGLVTRNIFVFCFFRVALFKGILSSTDFYRIIFLHVIHAHIKFHALKKSFNKN